MSKTLTAIAQQLKDANKKGQLIYAFNGSGKTPLSVLSKCDDARFELEEKKGAANKAFFKRIIQFSSHSRLSNEEIAEPTEPEKQIVKLLLDNITNNYGTWPKQEEQHG